MKTPSSPKVSLLFLTLLVCGSLADSAQAVGISVDWANGESGSGGVTTLMASGESAGVVPLSNWNSLSVLNSPTTGSASSLVDSTGSATTASVSWSYNNPWSTGIADTAGNSRMMRGYLDSSATSTTNVSLSNIPYALYDVYVYADGDNGGETRPGSYTIGGTTLTITDLGGSNFGGTFTLGSNYVVFSGLSGSAFSLNATPVAGPGTPRAAVNGIQIVQVPEPGSLMLGVIGGLVLLGRRVRARRACKC